MIPEAQEVVGEAPSWWKGKGTAGFLRKKHRLLRSKTTQEVTIASLGLQTCIQLDDSTCVVSYSRVGHLQLILSNKHTNTYTDTKPLGHWDVPALRLLGIYHRFTAKQGKRNVFLV